MRPVTDAERGMILINVLLFVAVAAGIVAMMLTGEDSALERAIRMHDADRAQAIAYGGEASALTALRRDAETAPGIDDPTEPWSRLAETGAAIEGGRFALAIADAQGRFNINTLMSGDAGPVEMLDRITAALDLSPEMAVALTEHVRLNGPLSDVGPIAAVGLDRATEARLASLVTALPRETRINANSASDAVLALALGDADLARRLVARRTERGFLSEDDLDAMALAPAARAMIGVTSDYFWVRTRATIGDARQQLLSLVGRHVEAGRPPMVGVVSRWWGEQGPPDAPRLP